MALYVITVRRGVRSRIVVRLLHYKDTSKRISVYSLLQGPFLRRVSQILYKSLFKVVISFTTYDLYRSLSFSSAIVIVESPVSSEHDYSHSAPCPTSSTSRHLSLSNSFQTLVTDRHSSLLHTHPPSLPPLPQPQVGDHDFLCGLLLSSFSLCKARDRTLLYSLPTYIVSAGTQRR